MGHIIDLTYWLARWCSSIELIQLATKLYKLRIKLKILCTFSGKPLLLSPSSMYRNYNYGMFNRNFFSGYKNKSYYDDYVNFHDKYNFGLWNPCCITPYLTQSTSPDLLGPSAPLIWHQGCSRFSPDINWNEHSRSLKLYDIGKGLQEPYRGWKRLLNVFKCQFSIVS